MRIPPYIWLEGKNMIFGLAQKMSASSGEVNITENVVTGGGKGVLFYALIGAVVVLLGLVIWLLILNKRYEKAAKENENQEQE